MSAVSARFLEGFSDTIIDVPDYDEGGDEAEDVGPETESRKDQ